MTGIYVSAKHNFSATTFPTTSDDSTAGYSVGSRWHNVTRDVTLVCIDATSSAAVWLVQSPIISGATAGDWILPPGTATIADRTPSVNAAVSAIAFYFPRPVTIDNVRFHVTTGQTGAEIRGAIYADNGFGRPGALIEDLGTGACTSSAADVTLAANSIVAGVVWIATFIKNVATQATFKGPGSQMAVLNMWQESTALSAATVRPILRQTVAYPGSAPDPCTTFSSAATTPSVPLPMIQVA